MGDDDLTYVVISVENNQITDAELLDEAPTYSGVNIPTGIVQYVRAGYVNGGDTSPERTIVGQGQPEVTITSGESAEAIELLHEQRARDLHAALGRIGVESEVHWDRSPWGVRIGLVEGEFKEYEQPSLFVLHESDVNIAGQWAREWTVSLGQFGSDENLVFDNLFGHILERPWLGENADSLAYTVSQYVRLLKLGAAGAHEQMKKIEE